MNIAPQTTPRSKCRLRRRGVGLTGAGLFGGLAAAAVLANGWSLPAPAVAALICGAAAMVLVGFAVMVVAADPFADEELEEPPA
jgi:peptidoglycan/LPS O-acetylase OafA/YrhL